MPDQHFSDADLYVQFLAENPEVTTDAFIASRHVGFVAVSAVTVYEIAIKSIFIEFGTKKHVVLGNFTKARFDRINGRIAYRSIWDEHVRPFGDKYVSRFKKQMAKEEQRGVQERGKSVISSYNNIVLWRNTFAHEGQVPANVTLNEAIEAYHEGKHVLRCLSNCMVR